MTTQALPAGPRVSMFRALRMALLPARKAAPKTEFLQSFVNIRDKYGDIVYSKYGPFAVYMLFHPDHVHQVTVSSARQFNKSSFYKRILSKYLGNGMLISDGEYWRRQRRLAQPAFHSKRISNYADIMVQYTERTMAAWEDGAQRDIAGEMMQLTLNVVAKTLFDADVTKDAKEVGVALTEILEFMNARGQALFPTPEWLPTPHKLRQKRAADKLNAVLMPIIETRAASGEDKGDLLSMLLMTTDEEGTGQMSLQEVRDEAMTIFLAGHETTANALTWTFYLLSQHPEIAARLHQEVDTVLQGRAPTMADLKQLPYTLMIIKEAMRMYPPIWSFARQTTESVQIGEYTLPAGAEVFIYPYVTHHDARFFPDPMRFDPERFSEESEKQLPKFAYFPFGGGPRICIGNNFAMMEAQLVLATIASRYDLALTPDQKVEPEALITLRPKYGMRMITRQRQPAHTPA